MFYIPTQKDKEYWESQKNFIPKTSECTRSSLKRLAYYVDTGSESIPSYEGLKALTDSVFAKCASAPTQPYPWFRVGRLLLVLVIACTGLVLTLIYARKFAYLALVAGICVTIIFLTVIATVATHMESRKVTPRFLSELKRYRDKSLDEMDGLVREFERHGNLSHDEAVETMQTSLFAQKFTDQPKNYFLWKNIGSTKFAKMYLASQ